MKRSIMVVILALSALTCFSHPCKVVLKAGGTVTVSKGDTVVITFSANYADGGFSDSDAYDKEIFTALGKTNVYHKVTNDYRAQGGPITTVMGDHGENTWRYIARKKGEGTIMVYIYQGWDKERTMTTKFSSKVRVK